MWPYRSLRIQQGGHHFQKTHPGTGSQLVNEVIPTENGLGGAKKSEGSNGEIYIGLMGPRIETVLLARFASVTRPCWVENATQGWKSFHVKQKIDQVGPGFGHRYE